MKIPDEAYLEWKRLYTFGDIEKICEFTGYGRLTISRAISSGESTVKVMIAINSFYAAKKKEKERDENYLTKILMDQLQTS